MSSTLTEVDWNAELVRGDLAQAVQRLKQEPGEGLFVGGVTLPLALADLGLIDEYEFLVQPVLAGHGPTLLAGLRARIHLELVSRRDFRSGRSPCDIDQLELPCDVTCPGTLSGKTSPRGQDVGVELIAARRRTVRSMPDPLTASRRFASIDAIIDHLRELGHIASVEDEAMTELDHGLQTAAILAITAPNDLGVQVAGLVHDLAHPWDGAGQPRHAAMGAVAVVDVLGDRVAALIRRHVPAKRYLVARRPEYAALLSPDSVMTLAAQGGPMSPEEVAKFESEPDMAAAVLLREADDGAKVPGAEVPGLDHWEAALREVAATHAESGAVAR